MFFYYSLLDSQLLLFSFSKFPVLVVCHKIKKKVVQKRICFVLVFVCVCVCLRCNGGRRKFNILNCWYWNRCWRAVIGELKDMPGCVNDAEKVFRLSWVNDWLMYVYARVCVCMSYMVGWCCCFLLKIYIRKLLL